MPIEELFEILPSALGLTKGSNWFLSTGEEKQTRVQVRYKLRNPNERSKYPCSAPQTKA